MENYVGGELAFSADAVPDRAALLLDAARRIDSLSGHLGAERVDVPEDHFGELIRGFAEDNVEFGTFPDVYPVPILDLPDADRTSAAWRAAREDGFTFWWVRFPLLLFPRKNWAFTRLEVQLEFNADEPDPLRRPKAFDILPNRRFDTVLRVGAELTVGVGADGHFAVDLPQVPGLPVGAGANAEASVRANLAFAPVPYRMVAARVNHSAQGLAKVLWRLDGAEFFEENAPELIVVLQVPKVAEAVHVVGVMQAYRRFNLFPAGLQAIVRELPEALRVFLNRGAPIRAVTRYDLTSMCIS
ncbi:MAG TPA: hypothetical protein VNP92_30005 [Actinophytocola sp.]|nr:hypothetical protein [Actinophytocola sp.]